MAIKRIFTIALTAMILLTLTCCSNRTQTQPERTVSPAERTTVTPVAPDELITHDYSSDLYFLGADRIRGDLAQMIGEEKSPVYLLACFLESCKTPLEGAREELFLIEAYDESKYYEKFGGIYDNCFTVHLCRQFDVGDAENGYLQLSLDLKFAPDEALAKYAGYQWFDTVDAFASYAGSTELFGYLTEQGIMAQKTGLSVSYTD
ncbi:MAG: hypothetical protein IJL26_12690 [Clostridia bacterium]|nr:hypothetical protein [Clostridia bacterium]